MSFSGEVKEELAKQIPNARHCQIAELSGIILFSGNVKVDKNGTITLEVKSENSSVIRKYFTLLKKTFNINTDILECLVTAPKKQGIITVEITQQSQVTEILSAVKLIEQLKKQHQWDFIHPILIQSSCCRRSFLRGCYLAAGSMSDPQKGYHLEFVCISEVQANHLCNVLLETNIEAKIVMRKKYFVVYVKEGSCIVDLLNNIEAHVSLMNLENLRIIKEMRNSINRRVNCETANIAKTVTASSKQMEDIILLRDRYGLHHLPENLRQTAQVRLEYADATLKELGEYLTPPIGKSGVNHRLRKLSELADSIRN